MKNKEIIITIGSLGFGGAQRRAINLANEFAKNGFSVYIAVFFGDRTSIDALYNLENNVRIVFVSEYYAGHCNEWKIKSDTKVNNFIIKCLEIIRATINFAGCESRKLNFILSGIRKSVELRSFFMSHIGATVIHFGLELFERVFFATKGLKMKIIYAETNAMERYANESNLKYLLDITERAKVRVFQTKEEMYSHSLKGAFCKVIPNPIRSDLPECFLGKREKYIVNFCRMVPQKNLMLLIKAFEKFYEENQEYKLCIYADDNAPGAKEYRALLESYIATRKLSNKVFLFPAKPNIHEMICNSAMFVSSSDYEGISNSMIEAMAIGLPCVCTDCKGGGSREMITDGENGLLVPVGDVEALSQAMHRMANEEGLAEKCGKNASSLRETLSVKKVAEQWIEVIKSV